ncbi:MAG: pyridoxine 5'-phosphate synthase [Candidatus Omnitrophica bacterium CG11_big_fil_rev_8_21_14_0_20_64_10]|nr:MAG: pyridoxine 5'-phosphate synthase [Candidatus Omnitrophica bacterium CG11_big_fil_rev_8_21_14_0_20_64_10]
MRLRRGMRLGVNVDHVATVRQARLGKVPDPVRLAQEAQRAGCDGIVCHLREDRRHIQTGDLSRFKRGLGIPLNLEMAAVPEIVRIACRIRPAQATLVPERRRELTTEGGLNLKRGNRRLLEAVRRLTRAGIRVSLFIDPAPAAVLAAAALGAPMVELHTGGYAEARTASDRKRHLERLRTAADLAGRLNLAVAAGHGLDTGNVGPVVRIAPVEELNIGFSIVARALTVGMRQAVLEMRRAIRKGKGRS